MLKIEYDKTPDKQPFIEWQQINGAYKRAWIQRRKGDKDWADTGRYLNVVRCQEKGRIGGNATDFPIHNDLPDEEILLAFVRSVSAITGAKLIKPKE